MIRSNLHCHSRFSDGADTLEELVQAAIRKGFVSLGFSEHAWTPYDSDCCMKRGDLSDYLAEARRLRKAYAGQIELCVGLEVDAFEPASKEGLDFTIGSVHYLRDPGGEYHCIDYLPHLFEAARDRAAGGSVEKMVRMYFDLVAGFAENYRPDVIGHVDLIKKLNGDGRYFDESGGWYRRLVEETAERIAATGCIVEVNTGGICRGYREEPYPSRPFLKILRALGVPVLISSDAHTADTLDFWFEEAEALLREVGYRSAMQRRGGRFLQMELCGGST